MIYRELTPDDYDAFHALLTTTEGVGVRTADSRDAITRYLERVITTASPVSARSTRVVGPAGDVPAPSRTYYS